MIRVLLVNEMGLLGDVIADVLRDEPDIAVVGPVTSVDEAIARSAGADVALTSSRLPDGGALRLTPREREVLDLVGKGLTNRQIADRLFIAEGTVKNHVHNILGKLDVADRREAAAYLAVVR